MNSEFKNSNLVQGSSLFIELDSYRKTTILKKNQPHEKDALSYEMIFFIGEKWHNILRFHEMYKISFHTLKQAYSQVTRTFSFKLNARIALGTREVHRQMNKIFSDVG